MTRGLTDPVMEQPEESMGDLPTVQEMDMAIRQLYEMQADMNVKLQMLTDLLGAAIATNARGVNLAKVDGAIEKITGL